jgi:hypothetical protein
LRCFSATDTFLYLILLDSYFRGFVSLSA